MLRWIVGIHKKQLGLCFISSLLLSFPFLNPKFALFAWFGFIPFFSALKGKNGIHAFILSYLTGALFWAVTIYWLVNVTLLGTILLVFYLALYFGVFGLAISALTKNSKTYSIVLVPSAWVVLEYLRSHLLTGFPWSLLGYSQYLNLHIIQIADISGIWGVSFVIVMFNTALYSLLNGRFLLVKQPKRGFLFTLFFLSLCFIYSLNRIGIYSSVNIKNKAKAVKLSVVQPNIPQEMKWAASSRKLIMERYFDITDKAAGDNPDLIIWPEAALPVVLEEEPSYYLSLRDYVQGISRHLLFGAVTFKDGFYYNSAVFLSSNADLLGQYDKLHLVPFGEYIPFRNLLKFLDTIAPIGDIAKGKDYTIFKFPDSFGVLICFEDVFPHIARGFVSRDARFLVNITNDAWFGKTPEASQHLAASVFRAIENRVFLVRSANTGISGFISDYGKVFSLVSDEKGNNIFIAGHKTDKVYIYPKPRTIYNRFGDFFPVGCLLAVFINLMIALRGKKE